MQNLAMQEKLDTFDCLDVCAIGVPVEPGIWELAKFTEDVDYCDASTEAWIWSIGQRLTDGRIFASLDTRYYLNPEFECLWLR